MDRSNEFKNNESKVSVITLIGMAGSGKSTIGKLLAKKIGYKFIDGDKYIEKKENMTLQQIIDIKGEQEFLKIEEKRILELVPKKKCILAPGGSIIYSKKLMAVLKNFSYIIFLNIPFKTIKRRLTNKNTRGIIGLKSKPIVKIYKERLPLYRKYADIAINCFNKSNETIVREIVKNLFQESQDFARRKP